MSAEARSRTMRAIRGRDTHPERLLRSLLWKMGLRFRKHRRDLPGTPDAAFASARVALFIDGDFWHGRGGTVLPKANALYWHDKIEGGKLASRGFEADLARMGWLPVRVWASDLLAQPMEFAALAYQLVRAREAMLRKAL